MFHYLVMTLRTPAFDPAMIPSHYAFLNRLRQEGRLELAGPFADRSGGAYPLAADSLRKASEIAHQDPLHQSGSSQVTVREWEAK